MDGIQRNSIESYDNNDDYFAVTSQYHQETWPLAGLFSISHGLGLVVEVDRAGCSCSSILTDTVRRVLRDTHHGSSFVLNGLSASTFKAVSS